MKQKKHVKLKKRFYVFIALGVVVVLGLAAFIYAECMLNEINYAPSGKAISHPSTDLSGHKLMKLSTVYNVLLIGTDSRKNTLKGGRSDSMILVSINRKTKQIVMTSFMRDSYVTIPGYGKNRLNAAYSFGGAALLVPTIEKNFDISINRYVIVNFYSFMDIIDQLGGVRVNVTRRELPALNACVYAINKTEKKNKYDGVLKKYGNNLLLTGKQALGYARIRHVGNADFERTQRQRIVLSKIMKEMKGQNIFVLTSVLNKLLPDVTTDLSKNEVVSLLASGPVLLRYKQLQCRIPADNDYYSLQINGADMLGIDYTKNIALIKKTVYNTK